ncbi:hypothetical protein LXA47_26375 [Massilia sp. P8910]|uniref:type II restriction endonuclease n=1 Tax=Massilia antarctica TaxID=2765360 RepID=UPI001E53EA94|nr:type II restriction endonuclease [Massilia antarctica]MCE3607099.1 hypothetical protein [Massilia antarctica]
MFNCDLFADEPVGNSDELVAELTKNATSIFLKKLSLNDWQWTSDPAKHQDGVYIFKADRDSGFFPPLMPVPRKSGAAEILETFLQVSWPALGQDVITQTRLVNWRSKGEETHLTRVARGAFVGLDPASFLLIAKTGDAAHARYSAITVSSESSGYRYLEDLFDLAPDFRSGIFEPARVMKTLQDKLFEFIGQALAAFRAGKIDAFAASHLTIPKPRELARLAQLEYQAIHRNADFNPFMMSTPGDAIRDISRGIEYELFKSFEIRRRSMELVQLILGSDPSAISVEQALMNIVTEFPRIDGILLSAAQTRKSRAGASFELHIERLLTDGMIPHEVQVVIDAKKRPDFVLPSFAAYSDPRRQRAGALVLSAKTTLRERWKQVTAEMKNCDLYLATVDENIAENAIHDMARQNIWLVVPESLKNSDTTVYKAQKNVISFKFFFDSEIRSNRMKIWESSLVDN